MKHQKDKKTQFLRKISTPSNISRRHFLMYSSICSATISNLQSAEAKEKFSLNYALSSAMYGTLPLKIILNEARKIKISVIDIWPRVHGNQREQIEDMGHDQFSELLEQYNVRLGSITRYDLGPFRLQNEMKICSKLGGKLLICGGQGPKGLKGPDLKSAIKIFSEKIKPHVLTAENHGIKIGIENHSNNLINTPDSIKWLLELLPSQNIGIALAPYHLQTLTLSAEDIANLIREINDRLFMFYAWQYGMGCMKKLPKEQELLQMPGRGELDFKPILQSLKSVNYSGYTSVFMHPVPRGIPILPTAKETTEEINRSKNYLDAHLTD